MKGGSGRGERRSGKGVRGRKEMVSAGREKGASCKGSG